MPDEQIKSPLKAIRAFCLECCGDSYTEVASCTAPDCPLYSFRFGKNPFIRKELTEEQKTAAVERLKKARESKTKEGDTDD